MSTVTDWASFCKAMQDSPCFWISALIVVCIIALFLHACWSLYSDRRKAAQEQERERLAEKARIERERQEVSEQYRAEAALKQEVEKFCAARKRQNLQKFVAFFPSIRSKTLTLSRAAKECEQDLVEATKMYENWLKTQPSLPSKTSANPKVLNCPACTAAIPPDAQGRHLCGSCGSTVQL